ncbi:MAG: hypothetical protein C0402_03555 [Thermodesulfovibrio sp.]|nr:hypothetical protein [Thermodesulfovibrio sp.]
MTYREKCDARLERIQQKEDAGLISRRYPEVETIVVNMEHHSKGICDTLLHRTLYFSPESHAYFHVECLNSDCKDCSDGFDLESVVASMIRNRASMRQGALDCEGHGITSSRVNIAYKVTIAYSESSEYRLAS